MVARLILELEGEMEEMDEETTNLWVEDHGFDWFQSSKWPNGDFAMVLNHL